MHEDDPPAWTARLAAVAGPLGRSRRLSEAVWMIDAGGRALVAKVGPGVGDEATGLGALGAVTGAPPVPAIVLAEPDLLVTAAVEQSPRTPDHEVALGRDLARLHAQPAPRMGRWLLADRRVPGRSHSGRPMVRPSTPTG